jgi:hypothetical protein
LEKIVAAPVYKAENTAAEIRCADHSTPSIGKMLAGSSMTSGGRSEGIVLPSTQATEFSLVSWHSADIIFSLLNADSNAAGSWIAQSV